MGNLAVIIGIAGTLASILFAFIGYQTGLKKDSKSEGKTDGVLLSDVGYIKSGVDDLKREQKDMSKNMNDLTQRVCIVEESTKQAHKRIDGLEGK